MSCFVNNSNCNGTLRTTSFAWLRPSQRPSPIPCVLCAHHLCSIDLRYDAGRPALMGATLEIAKEQIHRMFEEDEKEQEQEQYDESYDNSQVMCATCINDATRVCRYTTRPICDLCYSYQV